jgi:hypothetical protein
VTLTGFNGSDGSLMSSKAVTVDGPDLSMSAVNTGITIEQVSASSFTEGSRGQGGQRYVSFTYRVKNTTGAPLVNLTMLPVSTATTVAGTPFTQVLLFNGTNAAAAVAQGIIPTGSVYMGPDTRLRSKQPDVLQVFTESEVAAITPAPEVTGMFPYGFVTGNPNTPTSRTLPNAANANDYGGLVTFAFRYPLQATAAADPFTVRFYLQVVQDTETRMTESVEEREDTSGVRRAFERATALGATTVTVLAGSEALDPFETDYPGQRTICTFRTAGTAASPVTLDNAAGAYTELPIYRSGESVSACGAYYVAGAAAPANFGMAYPVTVRALDRYGNIKTSQVDSVTLTSSDGTAVMPAANTALVSGARTLNVTYTAYGNHTITATGRRLKETYPMFVNGMTRTWGGTTGTQWLTSTNWTNGMYPGSQDSVIVPGDKPNYPLLVANTAVPGITMVDGGSVQPFINLSAFDFTVTGNLAMGNNGTFTGTGRVILAGTSGTFGGGLSNVDMRNLRVTGSYSTTSNANVTGGRIVVQGGRLRSTGFRIRVRPS